MPDVADRFLYFEYNTKTVDRFAISCHMTLLCINNSSVRLPPEEHICYLYSYSMDYAIYQI